MESAKRKMFCVCQVDTGLCLLLFESTNHLLLSALMQIFEYFHLKF